MPTGSCLSVVSANTLIMASAFSAILVYAQELLPGWVGLAAGMAYLVLCWFFAGVYLSCVIHMGIAHRALDGRAPAGTLAQAVWRQVSDRRDTLLEWCSGAG